MPLPGEDCLKRVLQAELQLAHGDATCQGADDTKPPVGGVRWLAGDWRACQNVGAGLSEVRMVECIERFRAELKLVVLIVGHAEVFVYFGVDGDNSRCDESVSSYIAELPGRF